MIRNLIFIVLLSLPILSHAEYQRQGWPGEGRPGFTAKGSTLVLYEKPDRISREFTIDFEPNKVILWDSSRVVTINPALFKIAVAIPDESVYGCETPQLGDTIEYLQYHSEGFGVFRIYGKVCDIEMYPDEAFKELENPNVEWWVRVLDNTKTPIGWMLVGGQQINFLSRTF